MQKSQQSFVYLAGFNLLIDFDCPLEFGQRSVLNCAIPMEYTDCHFCALYLRISHFTEKILHFSQKHPNFGNLICLAEAKHFIPVIWDWALRQIYSKVYTIATLIPHDVVHVTWLPRDWHRPKCLVLQIFPVISRTLVLNLVAPGFLASLINFLVIQVDYEFTRF